MYTAQQKPASVYIHLNLYIIKALVLCVRVHLQRLESPVCPHCTFTHDDFLGYLV